jgi:hypothetical protein
MKAAKATLLMVMFSAALALGIQGQADWIKYDSSEGRYAVLLPCKPQLSTQESTTKTGEKLPQYLAACQDPDPGSDIGYMVAYFDGGADTVFSFNDARDGFIAAVHGTLVSEKTIRLGIYEGREFKASAKSPDSTEYIFLVRFYLVVKRIYAAQFIVNKTSESPRSAEKGAKFLDSFHVANSR